MYDSVSLTGTGLLVVQDLASGSRPSTSSIVKNFMRVELAQVVNADHVFVSDLPCEHELLLESL